jgi:signal transduction histidine kinase
MRRKSLTLRLAAASGVWVVATLVAAGALLVILFRDHIERRFDAALYDHLEELVAASEVTPAGELALSWTPFDPRFNRPRSGWYWQIAVAGEIVARSDSLWRARLEVAAPLPGAAAQTHEFAGPAGTPLRAVVQEITLPEARAPFAFAVAGPLADIEADVAAFAAKLALTLAVLAAGLMAAVWLQVRFGLRPLRALEVALGEIRSGKTRRLPETFPDEVQPVVSELNALLDHTAAWLERARREGANLAHALKNPLTVIRNEAREIGGERGAVLSDQAAALGERIDRFLSGARAAGAITTLGARTPIKGIVEDLRFSMSLIHKDRGLKIDASGLDELHFRGDAQDLEEMLGNLIDNACKWAKSRVEIRGASQGPRLILRVEDDGPGIPPELRDEVLRRGRRLDEKVTGSGLGLDIVRDIAELYGGALALTESRLGGLAAELDLPAAGRGAEESR